MPSRSRLSLFIYTWKSHNVYEFIDHYFDGAVSHTKEEIYEDNIGLIYYEFIVSTPVSQRDIKRNLIYFDNKAINADARIDSIYAEGTVVNINKNIPDVRARILKPTNLFLWNGNRLNALGKKIQIQKNFENTKELNLK